MRPVVEILCLPVQAHILSASNEIHPIAEIVSISAQARVFLEKAMSCIVSLKWETPPCLTGPAHILSDVIVTDVTLHIVQAQHGSAVVVVAALVFGFGAAAQLVLHHLRNRQRERRMTHIIGWMGALFDRWVHTSPCAFLLTEPQARAVKHQTTDNHMESLSLRQQHKVPPNVSKCYSTVRAL